VRFAPAIDQLLRDGFGLFLEVGPHPALGVPVLAMAAQCKVEVVASASLRRGQPARSSMLGSLCELYEGGARVAWQQLAEPGARTVPLPAYPWQRRRHWLESPDASALAFHVTGQRYEDGRMMLRASATA
jgi:acyl transferase domain-containing protein